MKRLWTTPPSNLDLRRRAWERFLSDPLADASAAIRQHVGQIGCVVDAGCGAGQELLPYLDESACIGVDVAQPILRLGRALLRARNAEARLALLHARAEDLPLRSQCADVVICRLMLQHVDARSVLGELARVLRPGGGLVVTFHHARYYVDKLAGGLRGRDLRVVVHALRVLSTGGRQRPILGMHETYLTHGRLRRLAAAVGLDLVTALAGGSSAAPKLLFQRRA